MSADNQKPVPAIEGRRVLPLPSPTDASSASLSEVDSSRACNGAEPSGGSGSAPPARPASPAGAEPHASRLDTGTNCDREERQPRDEAFRVLLRDFGEGLVETTVTINRPIKKPRPQIGTPRELTPEQKDENRKRAVRRARTAIRHSIMAAKMDRLLTLTYRENQTDPTLAWKHFARFIRLTRKRLGERMFPYVAVLERQKRGAIHVHAAIRGFQDVRLLRHLWHEAIGSLDGNIDVTFFRQSLPKLASYLTKYITKDVDAEHGDGDHRYKRSRGIPVPAIVVLLPYTAAVDTSLLELFDAHSANIRFLRNQLEDGSPKWLWACSW